MSQERVLIVEDEENERTGLAELVSAWGYPAETARDGAEGFEKVSTWAPSIVVTDLKMPRMGGLELLERIADDGTAMAVIVVTAQGTIDSAVQAMRMGAYDYLTHRHGAAAHYSPERIGSAGNTGGTEGDSQHQRDVQGAH
jgi:DNA-binding NtrC family response regulator